MTYIHLFEAAEKLTEMQWPDTVTDAEAFKVIESTFGATTPKPGSDNLFVVRALTATRYRAEIKRLLNADKLTFYDPLTRLKIGCDDAVDPLVKLEELQELLNKLEPPAPEKNRSTVEAESLPINQHWTDIARTIADECFDFDTRNECRDSLKGYSSRVMGKMQERDIKGPRGIIDNANYVMREALQGRKWWANKNK